MDIVNYYEDFTVADFDAYDFTLIANAGITPMVTWNPWDSNNGSANQPAYALSRIIAGTYDSYVTQWASEIKQWGRPLFLRFAPEMNGNWFSWSEQMNGNQPGQYVAAWRHVWSIFSRLGVTNASWVWAPNVIYSTSTPLAGLYPGDAYVNWVGIDGYNWGTSVSDHQWQTPAQVFDPTVSQLAAITARPLMITETASTEVGGDKATWIHQLFTWVAANPQVKGMLWFNYDKETDWRIESSPAATSAFKSSVAALPRQ